MKGNIYSREKCFVCGGKLVHDERRNGCFCEKHPQVSATRFYVRFEKVFKNFKSYPEAAQFLNGLRFKSVEGTFDNRDYQKDKPLGFENLGKKYLKLKDSRKSFSNIRNYIRTASAHWGNRNVKEINGADIEDFLFGIEGISEKTRANYKSTLSDFWKWLLRRGVINLAQMPLFPEIKYELAYRTITDWETQGAIINEVKRISYDINPKIWLGIELLASYTSLRPADLLRITEADFDEAHSVLTIHNPTKSKNKFKTVRLLPEHSEAYSQIRDKSPGFPHMPFFRHRPGLKGVTAESPFGPKFFKKWWDRACQNLNIEGLDLYGGTRHTTTTELARVAGADGARKASGHETNKAFDRYCQFQDDSAFEMAKIVARKKGKKAEIVELKKKKNG